MKDLLLLPQLEMATTKQVADFYEVSTDYLRVVINRNKKEIESDGMVMKRFKEIKKEVSYQNDSLLEMGVSYRGTYVFPKRAILRVKQLLSMKLQKGTRMNLNLMAW